MAEIHVGTVPPKKKRRYKRMTLYLIIIYLPCTFLDPLKHNQINLVN